MTTDDKIRLHLNMAVGRAYSFVFSCVDILNCKSKVIKTQLWLLYIYDAVLVVISIMR